VLELPVVPVRPLSDYAIGGLWSVSDILCAGAFRCPVPGVYP